MFLNSTIHRYFYFGNVCVSFSLLSYINRICSLFFFDCFLGWCYRWMQSNCWKSSLHRNICLCMHLNFCHWYTPGFFGAFCILQCSMSYTKSMILKRNCPFYWGFGPLFTVDTVVAVDLLSRLQRSTLQMPCCIARRFYNTLFRQRCML